MGVEAKGPEGTAAAPAARRPVPPAHPALSLWDLTQVRASLPGREGKEPRTPSLGLARPFFAPESGAGLVARLRRSPAGPCSIGRKSGADLPHPRVLGKHMACFPIYARHPTP